MNTIQITSSVAGNLEQLKEAAYTGLIGRGKPVVYSHYNWKRDNRETRFTRVLSFDQTKETPLIIENIGPDYFLLEVNKEVSWYESLLLTAEIFKQGKSFPELIEAAALIKHEKPEVNLIYSALERAKGKIIMTASCSHHSGETSLEVISLGKVGVAVCQSIEVMGDSSVYKSCDGNLYDILGLELNPSVKSSSEVEGEIIRKLTEEETLMVYKIMSPR